MQLDVIKVVLFFFKLVPQVKDLNFDLALAVMLQDPLVWLPLLVSQAIEVFGIRSAVVARLDLSKVALDVARGATATGSVETNVIRHYRVGRVLCFEC